MSIAGTVNWTRTRKVVIECDKKSIEEYDKAVMTLSGGALGLSFTFLKYVGNPDKLAAKSFLLGAWGMWGLSISIVLCSHYLSHRAMRHALEAMNRNELSQEKPGGVADDVINWLNPLGGILFLLGLVSLMVFVWKNV